MVYHVRVRVLDSTQLKQRYVESSDSGRNDYKQTVDEHGTDSKLVSSFDRENKPVMSVSGHVLMLFHV